MTAENLDQFLPDNNLEEREPDGIPEEYLPIVSIFNDKEVQKQLLDFVEKNRNIMHVISNVWKNVVTNIQPAIRELMFRHYPLLKNETRPKVVAYIEDIVQGTGTEVFLMQMYTIFDCHYSDKNIRDLYPELDKWRKPYCEPQEPRLIKGSRPEVYVKFNTMTEEEWQEEIRIENIHLTQLHNWEQKRINEFIETVESVYFKYFPELQEMDDDEWVVYRMRIIDEHYSFNYECRHVEHFIEMKFEEDVIELPIEEYMKLNSEIPWEVHKETGNTHDMEIFGEII
jgi:hypothetical protein